MIYKKNISKHKRVSHFSLNNNASDQYTIIINNMCGNFASGTNH